MQSIFHQHTFTEIHEGTDNLFECSCRLRIHFENDVSQETVDLIRTPGFDLNDIPGGTKGEFIDINGQKFPFYILTDTELLVNAKQALAFIQEQVRILEAKINADEEWAEIIGDEDDE